MTTIRATCFGDCGDVEISEKSIKLYLSPYVQCYTFTCPGCKMTTSRPADDAIAEILVAAGVNFKMVTKPAELDEVHSGSAIGYNDVIDFHDLLETADWFSKLTEPA